MPGDLLPVTEQSRLHVLKQLREGAGVTVYTGPLGAPFWSLASLEVKVRVVPDGTDYTERIADDALWAFRAVGLTETEAKSLAERWPDSPPTPRHRHYEAWRQAESLLAALRAPEHVEPLIVEQFPVEVLTDWTAQYGLLDSLNEYAATDWEWDIETQAPHGLAVSTAERNWYLPVLGLHYDSHPAKREAHGHRLREAWARFLKRQPSVMHNGKADLRAQWPGDPLEAFGAPMDDTLVMAYMAGDTVLGLKEQTRTRLGRDPLDYPRDHEGGMGTLPVDLAARYAAAGDTRNTFDLYHALRQELEGMGRQLEVYETLERPLVPILASMERYGTPADVGELKRLRDEFMAMEAALRGMWWARERLDISKDGDTRELVKRRTGYDPGSCSQPALSKIEGDWMDSILAYRRIRHRRRAFLAKHLARWEAAGRPDPYILYTEFNQAGSADQHDPRSFKRAPRSGRLSSSGDAGNLQNQPRDIRSVFTAPPGMRFWSLDYSGLELRIGAALSQDENMLRVLISGGDLHDDFRQRILELTGVNVGRPVAKQGNFNAAYGGHADMLGTILAKERAFLPYETRLAVVESRHAAYPGQKAFGERVVSEARGNGGWSETLYGRRRYDRDLFSGDRAAQGHAERALVNHTIQGTAADILKQAMVWSVPALRAFGAHIAMQVHDEICGFVPEDKADAFLTVMRGIMESVELPGLRLLVEGGHGRSWDEVH